MPGYVGTCPCRGAGGLTPYGPDVASQITHPAGCMSQFIKFFGEQILILWKFALLRKRILIFSPPPVGVVCYRGNGRCKYTQSPDQAPQGGCGGDGLTLYSGAGWGQSLLRKKRGSWILGFSVEKDGVRHPLACEVAPSAGQGWRGGGRRGGCPLSAPAPFSSVLLLLFGQCVPAGHRGHHPRVQAFLLRECGRHREPGGRGVLRGL